MSNNRFGNRLRTTVDSAIQRSQESGAGLSPTRLPITAIEPNPEQPRRYFDSEKLSELVRSVQERGVLQPIMVRPVDGRYLIVFGERRYQAARLAGLIEIPVLISSISSEDAELVAAVENLQREDLSAYEKANYTLFLIARELEMSAEEVPSYLRHLHRNIGKDAANIDPEHIERLETLFRDLGGSWRTFAVHGLRVLNLPELLKRPLQEGKLDYTKALVIQSAPAEYHAELLAETLEGLSMSELQRRVQEYQAPKPVSVVSQVKKRLSEKRIEALPDKTKLRVNKLLSELDELLNAEE